MSAERKTTTRSTQRLLLLKMLSELQPNFGIVSPAAFGYPLRVKRRDRRDVIREVESAGVASRLIFGGNLSRQSFLKNRYLAPLPLEKADEVMREWMVVGCNHTITDEECQYIADTVVKAVTK